MSSNENSIYFFNKCNFAQFSRVYVCIDEDLVIVLETRVTQDESYRLSVMNFPLYINLFETANSMKMFI